ncbi:hypothetical protein ACHAXR_013095 [Thalassiosira sp. AJA248-18]
MMMETPRVCNQLLLLFLSVLIFSRASLCHALNAAPISQRRPKPLTSRQLDKIIQSPHIGYVKSKSLEVFVIGTSHFRCNSAQEVTSLIDEVQPDGVVLELDPERVLRLTKQYAGFDENGDNKGQPNSEDLLYGADFLSAVNACQRLDVPLFLGDEYAVETKRRLTQQVLNWKAYSPVPLMHSLIAGITGDEGKNKVRVDLLQSFVKDPQKLTPILVTSSPPFLLASALAFFDNGAMAYDGAAISSALETMASVIVSFLASCLLFNTVIAERDEILTASTMQASNVLRSLKDSKSIRKKWEFTVNQHEEQSAKTNRASNSLPLFTLKTPLIKDAIRNLNLFEPRWLKMIDEVTNDNDLMDTNKMLFGCVRCTNKFYSAISVNGVEGRYADIIFEKVGTFAKIKELKEGKRPSGDRKIGVAIKGGDSFVVDESNLEVCDDGYMVATGVKPIDVEDCDNILSGKEESRESVRMVVVVGLLHGNGVVDLISKF